MTKTTTTLVIGDLLTILLFTVIGRESHNMSAGLAALVATLQTAAPFMAGWLLTAPWLGAFRPEAASRPAAAVLTVLKAILPALLVGSLLRALLIGRISPWPFYAAAAVFMLGMLLLWRLLFALVLARRLAR